MKVGILTFHSAHNYGAVLQAYGLQEYLRSAGLDAYIIDYRPDYITKVYPAKGRTFWLSKNPKWLIKGIYAYIAFRKIRLGRWNAFNRFISTRLRLYPYTPGMDFHEFDAVFIGSDQVWSAPHTGGTFDKLYFGEDFKCKVFPYAPSCTGLVWTDKEKEFLSKHLDAMTAISVRETQFKEVLQPLTKKDISIVVDPTLLAGRKHFEKLAVPINQKRPYILIYNIGIHPEVLEMAKAMAKNIGGDVIELGNGIGRYRRKTMREDASLEEFLGYIKNAACVLTTSFHGTAFSLMFHTPFYTVLQHSAADNRMTSLLSALNMEDRLINKGDIPTITPLNDELLDENLKKLTQASEEFIANAIQIC